MRYIFVATTVVVLALTFWYTKDTEVNEPKNEAISIAQQKDRSRTQEILEAFDTRLKQTDESQPGIPSAASQMEVAFEHWASLSSSLNKKEARTSIIRTLVIKPGMPELASKVLLNTDFAKNTFGKNQALGRILAIEILLEEARNLNPVPLRETLGYLSLKYSESNPDMGQRQDLEDLLSGYFQILTPDFPEGLGQALSEINFSKDLETVFMVAVLNNGGKQHFEEAMRIFKHHTGES